MVGAFYGLLEDGCPFGGLDPRAPQCDFVAPRPNPDFWSALLWKKTMGQRVLKASVSSAATDGAAGPWLRAYAHCAPAGALFPVGAVSLLLINTHDTKPATVDVAGLSSGSSSRLLWELRAKGGEPTSNATLLGGRELQVAPDGAAGWRLPPLEGRSLAAAEPVTVAPASYSFVSYLRAGAAACSGGGSGGSK